MPKEMSQLRLELLYHNAAQEYLRRLPPEHFMEATPQASQRKITLESLDLVHARRPDVQVFNELLVQYPLPRRKRPGQVVPDNMVVVWRGPIKAEGSYDVPLQPARPFWVLEYVSRSNKRKDYEESMKKYEHDLKVPYCLMFEPEAREMTLYRHTGEKLATVVPNERGRCGLPELEMEVGLHDHWVRFWFRGELQPLPANLLRSLETERKGRLAAEAKVARLRAELERLRRPPAGRGDFPPQ
jgi:Uma2 family endonuclease